MNSDKVSSASKSPIDKILNIAGIIAFIVLGVFLFQVYPDLPDKIPSHFSIKGNVDSYGPKYFIILFYITGFLIYGLISFIDSRPQFMNYPVEVNEENSQQLYRIGESMLRFTKIGIVVLWWLIIYRTIRITQGIREDLGHELLLVSLGLIFLPILYGLIRMTSVR